MKPHAFAAGSWAPRQVLVAEATRAPTRPRPPAARCACRSAPRRRPTPTGPHPTPPPRAFPTLKAVRTLRPPLQEHHQRPAGTKRRTEPGSRPEAAHRFHRARSRGGDRGRAGALADARADTSVPLPRVVIRRPKRTRRGRTDTPRAAFPTLRTGDQIDHAAQPLLLTES